MQKSITVKIEENEYTVEFPKVGDLIDIEIRKSLLSKNQYFGILSTGTVTANFALDMIDAASVFSVMIPELKEDLKVKNLMELSPIDAKKIIKVYKKDFLPWYDGWLEAIKGDEEESEEDTAKDEK